MKGKNVKTMFRLFRFPLITNSLIKVISWDCNYVLLNLNSGFSQLLINFTAVVFWISITAVYCEIIINYFHNCILTSDNFELS